MVVLGGLDDEVAVGRVEGDHPVIQEALVSEQGEGQAIAAHPSPQTTIFLVASLRCVGNSIPMASPAPLGKTLPGALVSRRARAWTAVAPSAAETSTVGRSTGELELWLSTSRQGKACIRPRVDYLA